MPHKGNPRITVVLTVRDREDYISECIESILNQSYRDFRFLIVDDNSTDRTVEIVKKFNDERIECVSNAFAPGRCGAQNFAYEISNTEYIANMDSDDIATTERLERQIHFMDDNPGVGVLGTYYLKFLDNEPSKRFLYKPPLLHAECKNQLLSGYTCFGHSATMIRTASIPRKLRFSDRYWCAEDYKYYSEIASHTKLANLPFVGLHVRIHKKNTSVIHFLEQKEQTKRIRFEMFKTMFGNSLDLDEIKDIRSFIFLDSIVEYQEICNIYDKLSNLDTCIDFRKQKKLFIRNAMREGKLRFSLKSKTSFLSIPILVRYFIKFKILKSISAN